jgi:hypothetical protein
MLGCNVRPIESGSRGLMGLRWFCTDDCRLERDGGQAHTVADDGVGVVSHWGRRQSG